MISGMDKMNALSAALLLALCLMISTSAALAVSPHPAWRNALRPRGEAGPEITLAKGGKALYAIVLPAGASTQESKAADDLAQWLGKMTGVRFAVWHEDAAGAPRTNTISVGSTGLAAASAVVPAGLDLGEEGYAIAAKNGNLFLTGGSGRGPINAVYALLEEDLGCRWYSRTVTLIPSRPTLKFRPVLRAFVPALEVRDPFYFDAFEGTWSLRNRTNSPSATVSPEWGGNMASALFVHSFATLVPPDRYFAEHPDYFSENDGKRNPRQLCVSNPQVIPVAVESVKTILRANPNARVISVSQNDSSPCCSCAQCKAEADREGSLAGPLLSFVNAVADEVGKEFPRVRISTLAYLDTVVPPKTVAPAKNVVIQLCTDTHAWAEPFLKIEETQKFRSAMEAWAAKGAGIHIWDYTCNFSHYAAPMPNWQVVTDSIRFFIKYGAKGVMLQGNYQSFGTSDGPMRCWVWAKQLWNPALDTRELMRDFVYGYYGKAADAVWEYQDLVWNLWEKEHHGMLKSPGGGIRYTMDLFSQDFLSKAKDCFARAEAAAGDADVLRSVEESELQILYVQLCQGYDSARKAGNPTDPAAFKAALDKFERIARRENVTHLAEGAPDFGAFVDRMRKVLDR